MVSVAIQSMTCECQNYKLATCCNVDAFNPFTKGEPLSPLSDHTPYHRRMIVIWVSSNLSASLCIMSLAHVLQNIFHIYFCSHTGNGKRRGYCFAIWTNNLTTQNLYYLLTVSRDNPLNLSERGLSLTNLKIEKRMRDEKFQLPNSISWS